MEIPELGFGIQSLPNELLFHIFRYLDGTDKGIFSLSTSCRRLHYVTLPFYLAAHGIADTPALASQDLALLPSQLVLLGTLQTALFIRSLKHISCSFLLKGNAPWDDTYYSSQMSTFIRHIKQLTGFFVASGTGRRGDTGFQAPKFLGRQGKP
jgi:hypothetical protein